MTVTVSVLGALAALVVAIVLILKKVPPAYGMMIGALVGGLVGGIGMVDTITLMMDGAKGMIPAVLRILAAGVLAGVLIESGGAKKIAETLVQKVGETRALLALAFATMVLTAVGVFIDVAVITVAPIALAMPLTSIMAAGIIPAVFGLIVTYLIAKRLSHKGSMVEASEVTTDENEQLPSFFAAILAPVVAIVLLSLRPIAGIVIDPVIALPVGGIVGAIAMGRIKQLNQFAVFGLGKMTGVAVMLIGTGTLAGIIANSQLKDVIINGLTASGLPAYLLAPISGALMSLATASTTAGTAVASSVFGTTIMELGVASLGAAAMIHAGATVFDHMPHGSFFHATGGSVNMQMKERLRLIPYETAVGLVLAIVSTLVFGVFGWFL